MKTRTRVIFRKYPNGEIIALFPDMEESYSTIGSYLHVGQHGDADYSWVTQNTKLATPLEYADLERELTGMGYRLKITKRRRYKKCTVQEALNLLMQSAYFS